MAGRFFRGPNEPDDSDDDLASLFGSVGDDDGQDEAADDRPEAAPDQPVAAPDQPVASNDRPVAGNDRPVTNEGRPGGDESATRAYRWDRPVPSDIDGPEADVDDDQDAFEPAFPAAPSAAPRPAPRLPDPREAPPSYEIPELSMPVPPRPDAAPRGPSTHLTGGGESTFFWGLTPNDAPDPLVHKPEDAPGADGEASVRSRAADEGEASTSDGAPGADGAGRRRRGLVPSTVPLAPYVPPVYDEPEPEEGSEKGPQEGSEGESAAGPTQDPARGASPEPVTPESSLAATLFGSSPAGTVEPADSPTIAVPAWTPVGDPPKTSVGDAPEPPVADEGEPEPEPAEPSAPGTVTLPWLTRSRSERAQDEAVNAAPEPASPEPSATVTSPAEPASPESTAAESSPVESTDEPPAETSSWSLFGDLFGEAHAPEEDDLGKAVPEEDGSGDAASDEALGAAAAPGDEITATRSADSVKASWPWGDSAAAPVEGSAPAPFGVPAAGAAEPGVTAPSGADAAIGLPGAAAAGQVAASGAATSDAPTRASGSRAAASGGADAPHATRASRRAHASRRAAASVGGHGGSRSVSEHEDDAGGPSPRAQRIMLIVAGALLLLLLLIALFIVGRTVMHPVAMTSPSPTPTKTATPTPTPTATAAATGPVAPGKHPWDALRGGECLQPFTTAWANTFTVVDCASPHAAQMVYTAVFSADPKAAFPGADALASQINPLCSRPGVLNLDAAGQLDDAQLQGTYPVTEKQWTSGQRSYYCFVSRSSGQPITGSLAGPGPQ